VFVVLLGRISDVEQAREITQDVLMAVVAALREGRLRETERLGAYVHGVARNLANNHLRARSRAPEWVELTEDAVWLDAEEEAEMADRQRRLRAAVGTLDPLDRRFLTLCVVEGHSSFEAATLLGITAEAVRTRKSRALKRLMHRLETKPSHSSSLRPLHDRGSMAAAKDAR
jgi:RNA polymerase sigma factor (sigma-70 family)